MRRLAGVFVLLASLLAHPAVAQDGFGPFKNWAAIVVAADFHAHSGAVAETFDNARRDISAALVKAGFAASHISQFSNRPERYPDTKPLLVKPDILAKEMVRQAAAAPDGCLIYFTSHGSPQGIVFGNQILPPGVMQKMIDQACGVRPTIVFVSACFSGVFVPELSAPNRMVMTAARPDRSSFGCREEDQYTFFDDCVLKAIPASRNFQVLADGVRACVEKKELAMRAEYDAEIAPACTKLAADVPDRDNAIKTCETMNGAAKALPPSEPQLSIGGQLRPMLALMRLDSKPSG